MKLHFNIRIINGLIFLVILFCCGCSSDIDNRSTIVYTNHNCNDTIQKIRFKKAINSLLEYNGQFVEIIGYYHFAFEQSALSDPSWWGGRKMMWVDFGDSLYSVKGNDTTFLFESRKEMDKIQGKKVKLRGEIDAHSYGHLSQYAGTIKRVCYLEILD